MWTIIRIKIGQHNAQTPADPKSHWQTFPDSNFALFLFLSLFTLGQSLKARAGALEHELVLCAIMSKLKLSEKYIYNIVYDMAAQADPSKAK